VNFFVCLCERVRERVRERQRERGGGFQEGEYERHERTKENVRERDKLC